MRLLLVDPNPDLVDAWRRHFPADATIHRGVFQDVQDADALATAGNSFGLMDGGIDLAVARAVPGSEATVQREIRRQARGELNVGAALVVPFAVYRSDGPPWLVYAPTMRVPVDIRGTDNVYRAMWAALVAVHQQNEKVRHHTPGWIINSLIVPGLGTGAGRMPPDEAARQMALAWRNFNHVPDRPTWQIVNDRHHEIAGRSCCARP